jgi:acetate kinase
MSVAAPTILTVNGGSSSIRFAVFRVGATFERRISGKLDRIGIAGTSLTVDDVTLDPPRRTILAMAERASAVQFLLSWLAEHGGLEAVDAVGHRVVHGLQHDRTTPITAELLAELRRMAPIDPQHLPRELELIDAMAEQHPELTQLACFDTAFHTTMPQVARMLAIPRRYHASGVRRYGFHGLSYAYLTEELARLGDPAVTRGRVVLAHLGAGASIAALRDGRSIDTSMGFTPSSGLPMGTRSGDLDPGLSSYLARTEGMTAAGFAELTNRDSGLLGVSGISSDVRDLLACEAVEVGAAEALALFCYQVKKWIGAFAAALGGLDTLVFAGGIGEHAPTIRSRICAGLEFLGVELDADHNAANASLVSTARGRVKVRVIPTDEELMIARSVARLMNLDAAPEPRA